MFASSSKPAAGADPEVAVLRSLMRLAPADTASFADQAKPPQDVADWIAQANLREVRGLLCFSLARWHTLGGPGD